LSSDVCNPDQRGLWVTLPSLKQKRALTPTHTHTPSDEQMHDYALKYTQSHCVNAPAATAVVLLLTQQRPFPRGRDRER